MKALQCDRCKKLEDYKKANGWIVLYVRTKFIPPPIHPDDQGIDLCEDCAKIVQNEIQYPVLPEKND